MGNVEPCVALRGHDLETGTTGCDVDVAPQNGHVTGNPAGPEPGIGHAHDQSALKLTNVISNANWRNASVSKISLSKPWSVVPE